MHQINLLDRDRVASVWLEVKHWHSFIEFPIRLCGEQDRGQDHGHGTSRREDAQRIMNVFSYETDATVGYSETDTMASAIVRHALFHRCALNITRYEVVANEKLLHSMAANRELRLLIAEGVVVPLTRPPQMTFYPNRRLNWQVVYENVALLAHFGSRSWMFFLDPDEFLSVQASGWKAVNEAFETFEVILFDRIAVACSNCPREVDAAFEDYSWRILHEEVVGKVAVRSDVGGLTAVHAAEGAMFRASLTHLPLLHFRHFYGIGLDRTDYRHPHKSAFGIGRLMQPLFMCDSPLIDSGMVNQTRLL